MYFSELEKLGYETAPSLSDAARSVIANALLDMRMEALVNEIEAEVGDLDNDEEWEVTTELDDPMDEEEAPAVVDNRPAHVQYFLQLDEEQQDEIGHLWLQRIPAQKRIEITAANNKKVYFVRVASPRSTTAVTWDKVTGRMVPSTTPPA